MKIGFYTSTFNDRPAEEVFDFARASGFDAIEIDVGGHIKTPDNVERVVKAARDRGLYVSSITLFGNQLEPDMAKRSELHARTQAFAKAIEAVDVPIFVVFPGRNNGLSPDDNYKSFADHAMALLGSTKDLQIAIENWPGPNNDFIATTTAGWKQLLGLVTDSRFGLEFDPSHLIRLGIDPHAAFEEVKSRVKILHGKDTAIDKDRLQQVGYHGEGWWRYVLPGLGQLDWKRFIGQARAAGCGDLIAIEHEDAAFGWPGKDLEARREGERRGLAFLRSL